MDAEHRSDQQGNSDRWLDSALRARVDAEPSTGMERRVLDRLAMEPKRRHFVWWPALVAIATVLVVAFGIVVMRNGESTPHIVTRAAQTQDQRENNRQPAVQAKGLRAPRQQRIRAKAIHCCALLANRSVGHSESLPKLAVFPTPRPETEQERLLARLAAQPDLLETAHLNSDSPPRELSIPALNIPPMEGTPADNPPQY